MLFNRYLPIQVLIIYSVIDFALTLQRAVVLLYSLAA